MKATQMMFIAYIGCCCRIELNFSQNNNHVIFARATEMSGPYIPFCRKQGGSATVWFPEVDESGGAVRLERRFAVFGGLGLDYISDPDHDFDDYLNDLWSLEITDTSFLWTKHENYGLESPDPRWKLSLIDYNNSSALLMFGGDNSGDIEFMNNMWSYGPSYSNEESYYTWSIIREEDLTETGPGARRSFESAVTASNTLVITNGKTLVSSSKCDSRTFSLDLNNASNNSWVEKEPVPALCRWGHTFTSVMTYPSSSTTSTSDKISDTLGNGIESMVMFGGSNKETLNLYIYFNDLWLYDPALDIWTQIEPAANGDEGGGEVIEIPAARDHHGAAYVEELDSLFIYGGRYTVDKVPALGDIWSFNFKTNQWKLHDQYSRSKPSGRYGHGLSVWRGSAGDEAPSLIVFGGEAVYSSSSKVLMNDVWLYSIESGTWREVSFSDCSPGALGYIPYSQILANVLFVLAGLVAACGVCLAACFRILRRKKYYYESIKPGASQRIYSQ